MASCVPRSPKAGDVAKTDSVTKTDSLKLEEEDEAAPAEAEARTPLEACLERVSGQHISCGHRLETGWIC